MKKILVALLCCCLGASMLIGCGSKEPTTPEPSSVSGEAITGEVETGPIIPEGMARSPYNGTWMDEELALQRPVAAMMGNTTAALPQYGIGKADIIYESPVEGGIVRLMAITQDYNDLEKIMSIRSCREYFVHWALEYDAIYLHYGQSPFADEILSQSYVHNLSGLDGSVESVMYRRDNGRSAPHNAYTTGELIPKGIEKKGYETKLDADFSGPLTFTEDDDTQIQLTGTEAAVVRPGYQVNKPWFAYNAEEGVYYRYQHGKAHVDGIDNSQLSCKNIILQVCDATFKGGTETLDFKTTNGGKGYYVTNGQAVPITWTKDSVTAQTQYYNEDGTELVLNQGKTWICIIQSDYADDITFEAAK